MTMTQLSPSKNIPNKNIQLENAIELYSCLIVYITKSYDKLTSTTHNQESHDAVIIIIPPTEHWIMALSKEPLLRADKLKRGYDVLQRSSCIAAIDFGTSSLSVAYTTPIDDGREIKILPLHKMHERVPNAILINVHEEQCTVNSIGHQAQSTYSDIRKDTTSYIYFERIKMLLERDKVRLSFIINLRNFLVSRSYNHSHFIYWRILLSH